MTHYCNRCKENRECEFYFLNDGLYAECQARCKTCKQCSFEAMSYNREEVSKRTEARRQWFSATAKVQQYEADLEAAIAAGDFQREKKARRELGNWEKKRADAEEEVGDAQYQHQR